MTKQYTFAVKPKAPTPRNGIFDLYWTFAARRQEIFERRLFGSCPPWTDDPILRKFKFCNVFRAADRVSQYLIRNVAYGTDDDDFSDRLFRIVAFRLFSKPKTWDALVSEIGRPPCLDDLSRGRFELALDKIKLETGGLYTGAFILCATKAFGFSEKHQNHVALLKHMFLENDAASRIVSANSLEQVATYLLRFPLIGSFMSYQIAIDLNYSECINFNENDYTQAGPGALRGIRKAFVDIGDFSPDDVIHWMVERQEAEFESRSLDFRGLWGRPLHAIDCQGLFCELDKYCREAVPELVSARSRIKARFRPNLEPITPFFPPKWGINEQVSASLRCGKR